MSKVIETESIPAAVSTTENPALRQEDLQTEKASERKRVPMSIPRRKLEVASRPGWVRHWMNDYPGRVQQALAGGYDFVKAGDVDINNSSLGADSTMSGNADMGSNISLVVGTTDQGTPLLAYLMEIPEAYYKEDQAVIQDKVDLIDKTIRRHGITADGESKLDSENRYVKTADLTTQFTTRRA
jgi:hypothetical protein